MRTTSIALLLIGCLLNSACVFAETPAKPPTTKAEAKKSDEKKADEEQPKTVDAAVQHIVAKLSADDKKRLRGNKKEDLIQYHHGWGTGIRNGLGLWGKNSELLADCSLKLYGKKQQIHPDSASMVIIEEIWAYLIKNPTK
jgi:hypothetical protein